MPLPILSCTEIPPEIAPFNLNGFKYLPIPPNLYVRHLKSVHAICPESGEAIWHALSRGDKGIRKTAGEIGVGVSEVQRIKLERARN